MAKTYGVGIMGAGNISSAYLRLAPLFKGLEVRAIADILPEAAKKRAEEFGVKAQTPDELLKNSEIDVVVNLTIPSTHYQVTMDALSAGKHAYSEKPFVLTLEEGKSVRKAAEERNLQVGSAPDTFLGGAHQQVRNIIDSGQIGRITSGTTHVMSRGMEHWHPNPEFFFQPGAGPVLDIGPYYITDLIQLIGPVKRVAAFATIPMPERIITSKPRYGQKIKVNTPTTIHAIMEFVNGAVVSLNTSWDVWKHGHAPIELYGDQGSLFVPDPNFFGGEVRYTRKADPVKKTPRWNHPFLVPNQEHAQGPMANYRTSGLADMAIGIIEGRPHRCSMELALHAIDVMTGILRSGDTGKFVEMRTTCERPAALGIADAKALMVRQARPAPANSNRRIAAE